MTKVCELCLEFIEPGDPRILCAQPNFSPIEFEVMGLPAYLAEAYDCGRAAHVQCLQRLAAPRSCCTSPMIQDDRCIEHLALGPGFLCLECGRWHAPACASEYARGGRIDPVRGVSLGTCTECARAGRVQVAVDALSALPAETLEVLVSVFDNAASCDTVHLVEALTALRDLLQVRVPNASKPSISPAVAARALQRLVATVRNLQSGLEREFYELLSTAGLDQEFRTQQPIPLEVADRKGKGRKGIVVTPDFVHRSLPYAIFLDGRGAHSSEDALVDDAEISTALAIKGFLVRRIRFRQLLATHRRQTLESVKRDLDQVRGQVMNKSVV